MLESVFDTKIRAVRYLECCIIIIWILAKKVKITGESNLRSDEKIMYTAMSQCQNLEKYLDYLATNGYK
jgi:hypothetical protein